MAPEEFKVNDFEPIWLYVLDVGRWLHKKEELAEIAERMYEKLRIFEGVIRYYTPEEIEKYVKDKHKAFIYMKDEKFKEELELFYDSDLDNIDPEYLENLQFFRAKLVGFEIILDDDRVLPVEVRLLYHRAGIIALEFWMKLKNMELTSDMINEFQLIPHKETKLTFRLPQKLLQDYSAIKKEWKKLLENFEDEEEPVEVSFNFHRLVWIYWGIIAYIATKEEAKDSKEIRDLLRYRVYYFFPILLFNFPKISSVEELLDKYKPDLYSMLTQEIYLKPEHLRPDLIDEAFDPGKNLSDRVDYGLFYSLESCMHFYTENSRSIQEHIAERRKLSVDTQIKFEKLDVVVVLEFLHIQKYIVNMFDYLLSQTPISEMETDELAQMRGRLSRALEEFHNIKLMIKTGSIHRCDVGKESFEIGKSIDVLGEKLEYVDAAVSSIHDNLMAFLSILIGVLVTIGPIIAAAVGPDYPLIASVITLVAVFGAYFLYKWIFKWWYKTRKN